jgi:hypothetical protein
MTLNAPITLDQYFHQIIKQPLVKEQTMFERTKMFFTQQIEKINSLLTKPTAFEDNAVLTDCEDGYWAFEMYTPEWVNEQGETVDPIHTSFTVPHEGTWMEVLDRILDAMEAHYGYNIKEQVYYSVNLPLNQHCPYTDEPLAGYGRCLNDERLQQILLAFPELYESRPWSNNPTAEVMFK